MLRPEGILILALAVVPTVASPSVPRELLSSPVRLELDKPTTEVKAGSTVTHTVTLKNAAYDAVAASSLAPVHSSRSDVRRGTGGYEGRQLGDPALRGCGGDRGRGHSWRWRIYARGDGIPAHENEALKLHSALASCDHVHDDLRSPPSPAPSLPAKSKRPGPTFAAAAERFKGCWKWGTN